MARGVWFLLRHGCVFRLREHTYALLVLELENLY